MKNNKQITFLLVLGVVFVQIVGMFLPFTGDAGKYAAISKNIFIDGDFLNLKIHGSPYYQKPPFLMWLSSAGYFIFGKANNFTTRFFPLLFTLLMPYATYRLGKLFYNNKIATTAALFIGTAQIYFLYNTDLHTDVILATCTTVSVWLLASYIEQKKWHQFVFGFVFIGLAMLTKGPIGAAVPAFAIGAHLLYKKNFKAIFRFEWLAGIIIVLIIIFPYLKMLYANFGWDGPKFYFWTNNAGRVSGEYRSNNSDPFFYLYNLLVFTLPWSIFFLGGLIRQTILIFHTKTKQPVELYTYGGSLVLLIILSLSNMKSPNYFYPVIPLLAIPAAELFDKITTAKIKYPRFFPLANLIQNIIAWLVGVLIIIYLFPLKNPIVWILIISLFILFIIYTVKSFHFDKRNQLLITGLSTIIALNLIMNAHLLPALFNYQATLKAAKIYNNQAKADAIFYTYRYAQFELFFYAKTSGLKIRDEGSTEDPVNTTIDEALLNKGAWFLANEYSYSQIVEKINIDQCYQFEHFYLTDINWTFLNPKTRSSTLQNIYLLKTKQ